MEEDQHSMAMKDEAMEVEVGEDATDQFISLQDYMEESD